MLYGLSVSLATFGDYTFVGVKKVGGVSSYCFAYWQRFNVMHIRRLNVTINMFNITYPEVEAYENMPVRSMFISLLQLLHERVKYIIAEDRVCISSEGVTTDRTLKYRIKAEMG